MTSAEQSQLPEDFMVAENGLGDVCLWKRDRDGRCIELIHKQLLDIQDPALWPALLRGLAVRVPEEKPVGLHTRVAVGVLGLLHEWMTDEGIEELSRASLELAQLAAIDERGSTPPVPEAADEDSLRALIAWYGHSPREAAQKLLARYTITRKAGA